jgi:flavin reductase (DIM6/NTAB) family NADH-FMN oxidoreductase RutF
VRLGICKTDVSRRFQSILNRQFQPYLHQVQSKTFVHSPNYPQLFIYLPLSIINMTFIKEKVQTHSVISPAILYWGTPVILISSENEDSSNNICPISSVFWLGHHAVLGFAAESKTPQNIFRTGQCVINLPDDSMTAEVNALATTTGSEIPSVSKISRGYRYVKDKWSCANLTPEASDLVRPNRIRECPVQMECELVDSHPLMGNLPDRKGIVVAIEVRVLRTHISEDLRMEGHPNRVDPDKWRPMIMSFQELYGLRKGKLGSSSLAKVNEEKYRALTRSDVVALPGDDDDAIVRDDFES